MRTSLKERAVPTRCCAVRRLAKQLSWRQQGRANINTLLSFAGLDQEHTGRVQADRQTGRQTDGQRCRHRGRQAATQTNRQRERQADREAGRQVGSQADRLCKVQLQKAGVAE